jgi:hypothetical protein
MHVIHFELNSSPNTQKRFMNFGNVLESGLLLMRVQQLEKIFGHACMKFRSSHTMVGAWVYGIN